MRANASGLPLAGDYASQHELLDLHVLGNGRTAAVDALTRYFDEDTARPRFTGRWFERFAGGGDRPGIADTVTEADVLALNFLSLTDLANVAIDTTITYAAEITELLEQIPADLAMHEAPWTTYAPGSPASRLWWLFKRCGGKDRWVTANKLLARKRPHLLPVYDSQGPGSKATRGESRQLPRCATRLEASKTSVCCAASTSSSGCRRPDEAPSHPRRTERRHDRRHRTWQCRAGRRLHRLREPGNRRR